MSGSHQIRMGVRSADEGWWPVGCQFGPGAGPEGVGAVLLRDLSADRSLLRPPVDWQLLGDLPQALGQGVVRVWRPVPPPGYVALSDFAGRFDSWAICIKQEHNGRVYARRGEVGEQLLQHGSMRLWSVVTPPYPDGDLDERLFLPVGGFTAVLTGGRPDPTPTTWILDLPAAVERGPGPGIPVLASAARPPAQTRVTDRTVTVPYFMVNDPARTLDWQIQNSPFYRIRRHRVFDLVLFRDNRAGTVAQTESQRITTGVTREAGSSFSVATGITVGASVGVEMSAKPFGVGASTTVTASVSASVEVGYETRSNVSTMVEEGKERGLVIPARSTGCLWMEHHELVPVRADGSTLGSQAALGFRTDYYVTGEFPGGAGVIPFTSDASGKRTPLPARHMPTSRPWATVDTPPPGTLTERTGPAEEQQPNSSNQDGCT
ncbi:hypothetical protein [Streptomyces microflavus]|uniref:hypothetical protein n=1 Tax=Streptomyces microflavus TaxID=1919 RepID=UPI003688F357